ncbi:hypothetical protein FHU30_007677 [Actinomadura rupiterrae]|nr:hypothetical protein [Actinomadura rupiterrae]MCP2342285.1 hypothetical protein [Actinomadura rupiterrae]
MRGEQARHRARERVAEVDRPEDQAERLRAPLPGNDVGDHRRRRRTVQIAHHAEQPGGDHQHREVAGGAEQRQAPGRSEHAEHQREPAAHAVGQDAADRLAHHPARAQDRQDDPGPPRRQPA